MTSNIIRLFYDCCKIRKCVGELVLLSKDIVALLFCRNSRQLLTRSYRKSRQCISNIDDKITHQNGCVFYTKDSTVSTIAMLVSSCEIFFYRKFNSISFASPLVSATSHPFNSNRKSSSFFFKPFYSSRHSFTDTISPMYA